MTTQEIKEYLALWADIKWPEDSPHSPEDKVGMEEILTEFGDDLAIQDRDPRRHWTNITVIKKFGDKIIGYGWADGAGDHNPKEVGWEFDWDTVAEYSPHEVTHTVYRKVMSDIRRYQYKGYHIEIKKDKGVFAYQAVLVIDEQEKHKIQGTLTTFERTYKSILYELKKEIDEIIKEK